MKQFVCRLSLFVIALLIVTVLSPAEA